MEVLPSVSIALFKAHNIHNLPHESEGNGSTGLRSGPNILSDIRWPLSTNNQFNQTSGSPDN